MITSTNTRAENSAADQANQAVTSCRQSSRNILPVRTNIKAGGRDEIAARFQEWMASRASEVPADETTV